MSKKEKSFKRMLINGAARLPDYLMINYLVSVIKYSRYPNAVFIKIPKTAGTSLLKSLPAPKLKKKRYIKYRFCQKGIVTFGHMSYLHLLDAGLVSPKFDKTSYKFTFVRNPFDRAVSLYHHLMKLNRYDKNTSFLDFCRIIDSRDIEPIGMFSVRGFSQSNTQKTWTKGINLDFVGRFEKLQEDYRQITDHLGIESVSLGHSRKSSRKPYSEYYCPESLEIIKRIYQEDFEAFGYDIHELDYILGE